MQVRIACVCDRIEIDEFNSPSLIGLIDRRHMSLTGGMLSFAAHFDVEMDPEPEPAPSEARIELIGPDGRSVAGSTIRYESREPEPGLPLGYGFSIRFDIANFEGRGPHEVVLVINGERIAGRILMVLDSP